MLRLFHSIFGSDTEAGRYPDKLVNEAIERAVDGTDPWLRGLTGYRRKLRPAVVHAIDHVVALTSGLQPPLELSREAYGSDQYLRLFFISSEQMAGVLRADPALKAYRDAATHAGRAAWALLVMACEQRRAFGVDLLGDTIVRDVAQITVSMADHRLLDPAADPAETRRLLMRRAFDHLLTLALARIAALQDVREDLMRRRTLLQAKHDALERSGWGFSETGGEAPGQDAELHRQLEEIEKQLLDLGGDDRYLEEYLDILIDVLANAEHQLWAQPLALIVDRMGIRRNVPSEDAPELLLSELHNTAGRHLVARMVMIPPATTI